MTHVWADDPAPTPSPPTMPLPADRVTLDFTPLPTGQPVIVVEFNGRAPARFLLNSGSNVSAITDTLAAKIGLKTVAAVDAQGHPIVEAGAPTHMAAGMMTVGTIEFPDFPLLVVDEKGLSKLAGAPIDGVLGVNALTKDPVFLDFQKRRVTIFYDAPITAAQLRSVGMDDATSVPFADHGGDLDYQSTLQLGSGDKKASADLTVDTGSARTVIPEETANTLGLKLGPIHNYGLASSGVTISDISIPSCSLGQPGTDVAGLSAACTRGTVPPGFPLRIGIDYLSHFQVLLDFGGKKLYLKPVASLSPAGPVPAATLLLPTTSLPTDRVTLDFTPLPTGQPVIWVYFDRKTPALFVLDSGTGPSVITDTMAAKLGLMIIPAVNAGGQPLRIHGDQAEMAVTHLMTVGPIQYPDFSLLVFDGPSFDRFVGAPIHGILGVDALMSDPVFLDFQKRKATIFYDTPVTAAQLRSVGMDSAAVVPLADHDLSFTATVQLSSGVRKASVPLTVDTGGPDTIISEEAARALGFKLTDDAHDYGGAIDSAKVVAVTLPTVSLGQPGTEVTDLKAFCIRGKAPAGFSVRLGLDYLTHFQMLIDFGGKKLYLKPASTLAAPATSQ